MMPAVGCCFRCVDDGVLWVVELANHDAVWLRSALGEEMSIPLRNWPVRWLAPA
jgi:hypothetical protein